MKRKSLKFLSILLSAALMIPPAAVLAKENTAETESEAETEYFGQTENKEEEESESSWQEEESETPPCTEISECAETKIEETELSEETSSEREETEPLETESETEEILKESGQEPAEDKETETETAEEIFPDKSLGGTEKNYTQCRPETSDESDTESLKEDETFPTGISREPFSLDESWRIKPDFRFRQVTKEPVISDGDLNGICVYDKEDEAGAVVGLLPYFSIAYVLEDSGNGWLYVESGDVRGFVKAGGLTDFNYASSLVEEIGEEEFSTGDLLVEKADNGAYTYTKTTVYEVLAEKKYAITLSGGSIYEYPSFSSRPVGEASSGTLAYILEDTHDGWLFVESDDVRGFVPKSNLLSGSVAEDIVASVGENEISTASQLLASSENRSLYYTLKSVRAASAGPGEQIAACALSLVGKTRYIYGGTSLTKGADCSGFTQSLYAAAGIRLPRLAEEQGISGEEVESLTKAEKGDLIYYESGPHVGIYIGDGKVVHCSGDSSNTEENPGRGVMVSDAGYMPITSIRRYLTEMTDEGQMESQMPYSQQEMELIWAIVAQEDCGSYEGALAVISSAVNRTESERWASLGSDALSQLTASGQYCYSLDENWVSRLNGNVPDFVKQAVEDCLVKGIRNHNYTSFRSYYTPGSVQIGGGNYYFS